eukprot:353674-Chlamydomonas_euryale.AAC.3
MFPARLCHEEHAHCLAAMGAARSLNRVIPWELPDPSLVCFHESCLIYCLCASMRAARSLNCVLPWELPDP